MVTEGVTAARLGIIEDGPFSVDLQRRQFTGTAWTYLRIESPAVHITGMH